MQTVSNAREGQLGAGGEKSCDRALKVWSPRRGPLTEKFF